MPELPEIQALAERLDALLSGARLAACEPLGFTALKTVAPSPDELVGHAVARVGRRGKYLVLELTEPGSASGPRILVHFSQGARPAIEEPPKRTRPKGAVVRFVFDGEAGPRAVLVREFGTERKAGWWVLAPGDEGPLAALGPEPGTPAFDRVILGSDDRRRIHTILRDQRTLAGIGRGYADDALHRARLSPFASLGALSSEERERLRSAIAEVLAEALDVERRRTGGLPPKLGDHFAVHARWGRPCPRCGADLRRVSYESYEVTYCPPCQTGGKVLADRRLSRLVR